VLVPPKRLDCVVAGLAPPNREVVPDCAVPNKPPAGEADDDAGKLNELFCWSAISKISGNLGELGLCGMSKEARKSKTWMGDGVEQGMTHKAA